MNSVTRMAAIAALIALLLAAAGCNTMEGLGEDIQSLGGSIEESAEENDGE